MAALLITKNVGNSPNVLIVDFNPDEETQREVEAKHGVSFSQYYQTREHAERSLPAPVWYSGSTLMR